LLITIAIAISMMIPTSAATMVRDENPAEGWVAGCAGASVVCVTGGVRDPADTDGEAEALTKSLKVPFGASCP
jgi:hypothetical protein